MPIVRMKVTISISQGEQFCERSNKDVAGKNYFLPAVVAAEVDVVGKRFHQSAYLLKDLDILNREIPRHIRRHYFPPSLEVYVSLHTEICGST